MLKNDNDEAPKGSNCIFYECIKEQVLKENPLDIICSGSRLYGEHSMGSSITASNFFPTLVKHMAKNNQRDSLTECNYTDFFQKNSMYDHRSPMLQWKRPPQRQVTDLCKQVWELSTTHPSRRRWKPISSWDDGPNYVDRNQHTEEVV